MEVLKEMDVYMQIAFVAIAVLTLFTLILIIRMICMQREMKKMKTQYYALTSGEDGKSLGEVVERLVSDCKEMDQSVSAMQQNMKDIIRKQSANLNHVAIMHYNAFDFTFGELSFSLAVLDDLGNGFVFTNIHNRDDARCYCKRVMHAESKHPLSDEEKEVLEYALNYDVEAEYSRAAKNKRK